MADGIKVLSSFKTQLVELFDQLIGQFPEEPDLVAIRIFLNDQVPIEDVMITFMGKALPLKPRIVKRDETIFMTENFLFTDVSKGKVNHFRKIWRSGKLDSDDKESIWLFMDVFVKLAEKYRKILRG